MRIDLVDSNFGILAACGIVALGITLISCSTGCTMEYVPTIAPENRNILADILPRPDGSNTVCDLSIRYPEVCK